MHARRNPGAWFAALAACTAAVALADGESDFPTPVADSALDAIRGGFEIPENLHAAFTLERAAYVNGELVAHYGVEIPDVGKMTVEQANALAAAAGTLVIQNGANNTFNLSDLGPASTIIQNSLNDQQLMTLTTISVEVNTLGAYREMNFQDGLRDVLTGIPGVR
jgi:hypothetical protein